MDPAGWVVVHMAQEVGFRDCKDREEVGQAVEVWVQGAGAEPPGEKRTGSKIVESQVHVAGTSSAEVVANRGIQGEGRTVQVQVAVVVASGFVVAEGGGCLHCLVGVEEEVMESGPD